MGLLVLGFGARVGASQTSGRGAGSRKALRQPPVIRQGDALDSERPHSLPCLLFMLLYYP